MHVAFLSWVLIIVSTTCGARYEANWKSLDSRPLPSWYDEGKIGIFIHWGVFAAPSYGDRLSSWFWYRWKDQKLKNYEKFMHDNYRADFTYADFAPMFQAEFFDPDQWANIFEAAGANYVVLTSKHHEGFTNWPSKYSFNWNSMDVGPNRDLVGDLASAIRKKTKIRFGLYHSLFEWFHPLFKSDEANGFRTQEFVKAKTMPELYELVTNYKPDIVWSDGEWMASDTYWNSTQFVAWLYNDSPVKDYVVTNDRWGNNTECKHGGFWNCRDHYTPSKALIHKWENCMTLDWKSWGFRRNTPLDDVIKIEVLIEQVAYTVSLGGNLLLNVGPTSSGEITPIYEERLRQMGSWLKVNGEAIYKTHMWTYQNDSVTPKVWYTSRSDGHNTTVYATLLEWPTKGQVHLGRPVASSATQVTMVGLSSPPFSVKPIPGGGITITIPPIPVNKLPCEWAWVLKITGLKNHKAKPNNFSYSPTRISML